MSADASALRAALSQLMIDAGDDATVDIFNGLDVPVDTGDTKSSGNIQFLGGGEGEASWLMEFTTPQAHYTDDPVDVIRGNPWLVFQLPSGDWVKVREVTPSRVHEGWWTDNVTEEAWATALQRAVAANAP